MNQGRRIVPAIIFSDGSILVEPSNAELAEKLGLAAKAERTYYDVIIVGGGPAGLTAALYTAREGLETLDDSCYPSQTFPWTSGTACGRISPNSGILPSGNRRAPFGRAQQ